MDYDKFIDQDQVGTFCILFQNKHGLDIEEIREVFSNFGRIHKINSVGDERGYRFIRYKSYNEAKNAINGLSDHPKIKFSVPRNRNKSNSSIISDKENYSNFSTNFNNTNNIGRKQFKNSNDSNKSYQGDSFKSEDYKETDLQFEQTSKEENIKFEIKNSEKGSTSSRNTFAENKSFKSLNSLPALFNGNKNQYSKISDDEIPNLIVRNGNVSVIKHKKLILDAEEVIVGNIHPKFGAPYILHLFDRFEPIAISKINIMEKTGTRYCHVYFKSVQDSLAAETLFDQTDLSGQKLVVLRPCRLMEEAIS